MSRCFYIGQENGMTTYRNKLRIATGLALVAALAGGIVGGRLVRLGQPGEHFWLVYPALLAICALALAACIPWWRKLDDMQKAGHLVSWYWGGLAGALAVVKALVAATGVHSDLSKGALFTIVGQAIAFLLAFAGWQLWHRGPQA
jgi:hypothetical protein